MTKKVTKKLVSFAIFQLKVYRPKEVISGMALGWDQAIAHAAYLEKIPFVAAIPFRGQELMWPKHSQELYNSLVKVASEVEIICSGEYSPSKMQTRNEWMVNNSSHVMALWDGTGGGTKNCVDYALKINKPVINVWSEWRKYGI